MMSGVSAGNATTSNTVVARSMNSGANASAAASAPCMPSGVTLTMRSKSGSGSSATQWYRYFSARAPPASALRASTLRSAKPAPRNAATTAFAMPPEPRTSTRCAGSRACSSMSIAIAS